ncbi:MAG: GNAT family N-acetyltransferase [Nitrospiraceae bacterium]
MMIQALQSLPGGTLPAIRAARAADGPAISALYREAYTPPGHGDARRHYPFPQFLDPEWVAHAVTRDNICWLVAEFEDEVIGTVGAIRNIGSEHDRVAEGFGLVVSERLRGRGIGNNLLDFLCNKLDEDVLFMIAETRTADPGGWKIVRRCGFIPLGFEPFAHATPAGAESMLLTGKVSENDSARRDLSGQTTSSVHMLARHVLNPLQLEALSVPAKINNLDHQAPWELLRHHLIPAHPAVDVSAFEAAAKEHTLELVRDGMAGARLLAEWGAVDPHGSGVVGLRRLEGEDNEGDRYDGQYLVGRLGRYPVACARLVWDRLDSRVRVLALQTLFHGLQGLMLARILEGVERESAYNPLTVIVDVRADSPELQATIERLGFFPTAYYPSLIATRSGRIDAVQYTRLYHLHFEDSLRVMSDLDWSSARQIISEVVTMSKTGTRLVGTG